MTLTFLGTATSVGVPMLGCDCPVCTSSDPRDYRLRCSALLEHQGRRILFDCGPDFRAQALRHGITSLDAVLLTHEHYDHVGGLDDVRPLGDTQIYAEQRVLDAVHRVMPYCFGANKYPGSPTINLHPVSPLQPFDILPSSAPSLLEAHTSSVPSSEPNTPSAIPSLSAGTPSSPSLLEANTPTSTPSPLRVTPLRVLHHNLPILGYRIGDFAYITDASALPSETFSALRGVRVLVLNALQIPPHPAHFSLDESIDVARQIGAEATYFTHFSHKIGLHALTDATLPPGMHLAFDNLTLTF